MIKKITPLQLECTAKLISINAEVELVRDDHKSGFKFIQLEWKSKKKRLYNVH